MKTRKNFYILFLITLFTIFQFEFSVEKNIPKDKDDLSEDENPDISGPIFSLESGFYNVNDVKELTIKSNETIYYTLDGSDPTTSETSKIYTKPILMYDRSSEANVYSKYQHEEDSPYSITLLVSFRPNKNPFDKATIVRAVSKSDEGKFSQIITKTYFIMEADKLKYYSSIPAISIVTDPSNLFDKDKGIYVCGQKFLDWKKTPGFNPNFNPYDDSLLTNLANFYSKGKEWEREAVITYFRNGKLGFSTNMGIRIKGASTRNKAGKSFNVYAKSKYGESKLKYSLIEDNLSLVNGKKIEKYDSFGLRNIEWIDRLREKVVQTALSEIPNLVTYDSDRCMLFIDGEMWGLYEIIERSSDFFIHSNYDIPSGEITLVKNNELEEGLQSDLDDLLELDSFCKSNSLSDDENYKYVTSKIDIESIIQFYSTGFYVGIWDWPNKNYLAWRNNGKPIEGNTYSDGKWRFGAFDFDYSVGLTYDSYGGVEGYQYDNFQRFETLKNEFPSSIFTELMKNSEFKQLFAKIFCNIANSVFEPKKMSKIIDELENKYKDYISMSSWRWTDCNSFDEVTYDKYGPEYDNYLKGEDKNMKEFFNHRAEYVIEHAKKYFGINDLKCQK